MPAPPDPVTNTEPGVPGLEGGVTSSPTVAANMEARPAQTVRVLNMGSTMSQMMEQMKKQARSTLTATRNSCNRIAPARAEEMEKRFADTDLFLDWLPAECPMTPRIKTSAGIELALKSLVDPKNNVPEGLAGKAKALLAKYEAENWGEDIVPDEDLVDGSNAQPQPQPQPLPAVGPNIGVVQLPAANDPTFGVHGIMYGVITDTSGKRKDYHLRTDLLRKSPKVYGHNEIALGSWYPFQINALFWGAHGARMGGIAGSVKTGAWSIVVAPTYEDLDTDHGDTIYYSGPNSHDNTNPQEMAPASQGTKALTASYRTQKPIRVLRSGGSSNRSRNARLPSCGLRYDGLYHVTSSRHRLNKKGGLYEQFKLERLPGQTPLSELQRSSPTIEQVLARDQL